MGPTCKIGPSACAASHREVLAPSKFAGGQVLTRFILLSTFGGSAGRTAALPELRRPSGRRPSGLLSASGTESLELVSEGGPGAAARGTESLELVFEPGGSGAAAARGTESSGLSEPGSAAAPALPAGAGRGAPHAQVMSRACTEGDDSTKFTDNLFGVDKPMREDGGLVGSQSENRRAFGPRRCGLPEGLQQLDWFRDTIQGLPPSFVSDDGERAPLHRGDFSADRRKRGRCMKANAAWLRDFSTTSNIVDWSRTKFMKLLLFNVGEGCEAIIEFMVNLLNE